MHRVLPACLVFALVVAGPVVSARSGAQASQTFQARVDVVHLPVVVTERNGTIVTGLTAEDFEVIDEGQPQAIQSFAEGPPGASMPLYLGAMLDKSESMELNAKSAADALVNFVEAMPEATDVTLVEFDSSVRVSRYSPNSYERLFERVRDRKPGRETALYDAMGRYVEIAGDRQGLHVLLVYTDGGDSGRGLNATELQARLQQGNVLVYGIVYLENEPVASERARQRYISTELVRATGGEAFFPSSPADVDRIYERIRAEMAARYTLGYAMPADATGGQFRRVTVRLRDSRDGRRVRTRSGYTVPAP